MPRRAVRFAQDPFRFVVVGPVLRNPWRVWAVSTAV